MWIEVALLLEVIGSWWGCDAWEYGSDESEHDEEFHFDLFVIFYLFFAEELDEIWCRQKIVTCFIYKKKNFVTIQVSMFCKCNSPSLSFLSGYLNSYCYFFLLFRLSNYSTLNMNFNSNLCLNYKLKSNHFRIQV